MNIGRPRVHERLPVVLSPDEAAMLLALMPAEYRLSARLLYETGMRISEGLRLRVKDVEFDRPAIIAPEGKGSKDWVAMLPQSLVAPMQEQLARSWAIWLADRAAGRGGV